MDGLRPSERVFYGIYLASWAVDRALESMDSNAVSENLEEVQEDLQQTSEQFSNVVAGRPADRRPREDVLLRIRKSLSETHQL